MILILHGWQGSNPGHWQIWMREKLEKNNISVCMPDLPNKDFPILSEWSDFVYSLFTKYPINKVVCHSLANVFWVHFSNKYPEIHIQRLLLVAPVSFNKIIPEAKSFYPLPCKQNIIHSSDKKLLVLSNNDPYCSLKDAYYIEKYLNIKTKWLPDSGHINIDSGFGVWNFGYKWITDN